MFIIVERPNNYAFGYNMNLPKAPGERSLSYKICPLFMHSICYWDACIHFWVRGDKFSARCFSMGEFSMRREVSGNELVRGNYTVQEFARILLICLDLSFLSQFYVQMG